MDTRIIWPRELDFWVLSIVKRLFDRLSTFLDSESGSGTCIHLYSRIFIAHMENEDGRKDQSTCFLKAALRRNRQNLECWIFNVFVSFRFLPYNVNVFGSVFLSISYWQKAKSIRIKENAGNLLRRKAPTFWHDMLVNRCHFTNKNLDEKNATTAKKSLENQLLSISNIVSRLPESFSQTK